MPKKKGGKKKKSASKLPADSKATEQEVTLDKQVADLEKAIESLALEAPAQQRQPTGSLQGTETAAGAAGRQEKEKKEKKKEEEEDTPECFYCGLHASEKVKLFRCAGCHQLRYCSKEHQRRHWKIHKNPCKAKKVSLTPRELIPREKLRVVVCGAGVTGAAIAYFLSLRGVKPIIIERGGVACAASGKAGGFLAQNWCDNRPREKLMRLSWDLHAQLNRDLDGEKSYAFRGVDTAGIAFPEIGAKVTRQQAALLKPVPKVGTSPCQLASWVTNPVLHKRDMGTPYSTAQVHPKEFTETLINAALANGAQLVMGTVDDMKFHGSPDGNNRIAGVSVDGTLMEADVVVNCMGPWAGLAQRWLGPTSPQMYGQKCHSVVFRPTDPDKVSPTAVFIDFDGREFEPKSNVHPVYEFYPRTHMDSKEVYIHGMDERWRVPTEKDPLDVVPSPGSCERLIEVSKLASPTVGNGQVLARQACYMPVVPDGEPMMGKVPGMDGAYICSGMAEWGITLAPANGLTMTELILDGASSVSLHAFRPERYPAGYRFVSSAEDLNDFPKVRN